MIRLAYSSGEVDEAAVDERIREFAQHNETLRVAVDFVRSAPAGVLERARATDPRARLLKWAREGSGRAWEGADLAAQILTTVEDTVAPLLGPAPELAAMISEFEREAESTRDWLDIRREEHPTWVPGLTGWLIERLVGAQTALGQAIEDWQTNRVAATVEGVDVERDLAGTLVEVAAPRSLHDLTPEEFEILVAESLDAMGLDPIRLGPTHAPDGGIDIIAVSRDIMVPLILAVQVKHHRGFRKTGAPDVQRFVGALEPHALFAAGMLVTNTNFTPNARWVADHAGRLLLLRDEEDLKRWIRREFLRSVEWREIPRVVQLGRGIEVRIPHVDL